MGKAGLLHISWILSKRRFILLRINCSNKSRAKEEPNCQVV